MTLEINEETSAKDVSSFSSSANGFPNVVSWLTSSLMLRTLSLLVLAPKLELLEDTTLAVSTVLIAPDLFLSLISAVIRLSK